MRPFAAIGAGWFIAGKTAFGSRFCVCHNPSRPRRPVYDRPPARRLLPRVAVGRSGLAENLMKHTATLGYPTLQSPWQDLPRQLNSPVLKGAHYDFGHDNIDVHAGTCLAEPGGYRFGDYRCLRTADRETAGPASFWQLPC